jgi:short-subunit dehydrogenase
VAGGDAVVFGVNGLPAAGQGWRRQFVGISYGAGGRHSLTRTPGAVVGRMTLKILITGASSGIGAATAKAFAAQGHQVGMCARRKDRLEAVAGECGGDTHYWVADLSDLDAIPAFAETVDEAMGGVDVLVNNAGVPRRRRVKSMTPDDVETVMAMNYFSPVRLTLAFLPRMLDRGVGEIINVSSMGVHSAAFGVGAYAASKAALELFTESMYLELSGTDVRARLFVPGTTQTEFSDDKPGNDPAFRHGGGSATAEDVAAAIVASVGDDRFVRYASDRDGQTAAAKAADPDGFLAKARAALAPLVAGS